MRVIYLNTQRFCFVGRAVCVDFQGAKSSGRVATLGAVHDQQGTYTYQCMRLSMSCFQGQSIVNSGVVSVEQLPYAMAHGTFRTEQLVLYSSGVFFFLLIIGFFSSAPLAPILHYD